MNERTRYNRTYMARRRGGRSYIDELEAIQRRICEFWDAGQLTEGQAANLLGLDRFSARGLRLELLPLATE